MQSDYFSMTANERAPEGRREGRGELGEARRGGVEEARWQRERRKPDLRRHWHLAQSQSKRKNH